MVLEKGKDDFSLPSLYQQEVAEQFPFLVTQQGMRHWQEESIPEGGNRLVVGVTTASRPDMQLLDLLRDTLPQLQQGGIQPEIFNVLNFQTLAEFEKRIPGLGMVYHTPVVGIWKNGELVARASGFEARQLLTKYLVGND
jgi:hypothetical protein